MDDGEDSFLSLPDYIAASGELGSDAGDTLCSYSTLEGGSAAMPCSAGSAGHPGEGGAEHVALDNSGLQCRWDVDPLDVPRPGSAAFGGETIGSEDAQGQSPAHVSPGLKKAFLAVCQPTMSTRIPDPFEAPGAAHVIAFGPNAITAEEASVLEELSKGTGKVLENNSPLASVVRRLFETIRFQRTELEKVKGVEVHQAEALIEEERRRHSIVARRRSLVVEALSKRLQNVQSELDALRSEHARCGSRGVQPSEICKGSKQDVAGRVELERERAASEEVRRGFLVLAKRSCPELSLDSTTADILAALEDALQKAENRPANEAKGAMGTPVNATKSIVPPATIASPVDLEHYGQRLLDLERILKESEEKCAKLSKEKTDLHLFIAGLKRRSSVLATSGDVPNAPADSDADSGQLQEELRFNQEKLLFASSEADELRDEVAHLKSEREEIEGSLMAVTLQLDAARSENELKSAACSRALKEREEMAESLALLTTKHQKMSSELTENTFMAVKDLQQKEDACQRLEEKLVECQGRCSSYESTVSRLSANISVLESELLSTTEQLAKRASVTTTPQEDHAVVDDPSSQLGAALLEKTTALEVVKSEHATLAKTLSSVKEECRRLKEASYAHQNEKDNGACFESADLGGSSHEQESAVRGNGHSKASQAEESFLRRLSARLGCGATSSRELLAKLVNRIEQLMKERRDFEGAIDRLQEQIILRERSLHLMRSEYSAEISALKAELKYVENDRARAVADREAAEVRYLESAKRDDTSTFSINEDVSQPSLFNRSSMSGYADSATNFPSALHWNDPSVEAAIKSLDVLIGSKADLDARNKALIEKLNRLSRREFDVEGGTAAATRAVAIESRTMNEELVGIVTLQQEVIQKLRATSVSSEAHDQSANLLSSTAATEDPVYTPAQPHVQHQEDGNAPIFNRRDTLSEAADFLKGQLEGMRSLCEDRAKANIALHGVVREMEVQLQQSSKSKQKTEKMLQDASKAQTSMIFRLAQAAGTAATVADVELFVCESISSIRALQHSLGHCESRCADAEQRLLNVLAQKNVLSLIISLYVNKYQLDIFSRTLHAPVSGIAKVRRVVFSMIAISRARRAANRSNESDSSETFREDHAVQAAVCFHVPGRVNFLRSNGNGIQLESAIVALEAIPKLESALADREKEIAKLQASFAALEAPSPRPPVDIGRNGKPDAFDYKEDVVDRKNDLARRLRAARKERDDLGLRLMREKRERQALEVKNSKYVAKLSSYQRRLGRAKNSAESQERFYKNAILYLRRKADHAMQNGDLTDMLELETRILLEQGSSVAKEGHEIENTPDNHQASGKSAVAATKTGISEHAMRAAALLDQQIRSARAELVECNNDDTNGKELESYVAGLVKAAAQVRRSIISEEV